MRTALRRLLEQRANPLSTFWRTLLLAISTVGIVAASVWAWESSNLSGSDLEWGPIVLLLVLAAPLSLALKAAEYRVAAGVAGQQPDLRRSLDVAVVSSAANLLPLPGSLLVTVRSLSEDGTTYGGAIAASAVPGLTWLGITGVGGGIAIAVAGPPLLGGAVALAGAVGLLVALSVFRSSAPPEGRLRLGATVVVVETCWLGVSALRLGLAVSALGVSVDPAQAFALSVAGAVTVAIGFFPGGLGVREALIAALSPMIGLPFDTGVLIGSLDRVVWLVFLALAAAVMAATRRR